MTQNGRVDLFDFHSQALTGNPLCDPARRIVPVYLPPGYDEGDRRYPVLFALSGFSGHGRLMVAERTFAERLDERLDRLISRGLSAPAIVVMPDAFTRLGGSQYMDSAATGRYESMIVEDLLPAIDARYRTDPLRRGVFGKSSGGFGALRLAARFPERFPALAAISADAYFEYVYPPEFTDAALTLDRYDGSIRNFLAAFAEKLQKKVSSREFSTMNVIAMAACYSPDPLREMGIALPFHQKTGRLDEKVFDRWLAFDPVRFLATDDGIARVRSIHIECGLFDEYRLQTGARLMDEILTRRGIVHSYEEFEDGHRGLDYRLDQVIPRLVRALSE